MTCERCKELFVEALYGDLQPEMKSQFDTHLASCAQCGSEFKSMRSVLDVMNRRVRTEPDGAFWEKFWDRVAEKIDHGAGKLFVFPGKFTWRLAQVPAWGYGIAAALLVFFGVYLGRTFFIQKELGESPKTTASTQNLPHPNLDTVEAEALRYLAQSKNLLIDLVNFNEERQSNVDLTRRQELSRRLITRATVLKASLNRPDQQQMRELIADLEVILVQLANIEVKPGVPAVELVRKGIDKKSIILKINIEEMRALTHPYKFLSLPDQDKKTKTSL